MLLSGSYPGAFLVNSQRRASCEDPALPLGRIDTFLSSHLLPQEHHFTTAEHRKYWLKVIVVPLEGLKGAGVGEKQLTLADCSEGQGPAWLSSAQLTVSPRVSLRLAYLSWRCEHCRVHRFLGRCRYRELTRDTHLHPRRARHRSRHLLLMTHHQPSCLWGPSEAQALEPPPAPTLDVSAATCLLHRQILPKLFALLLSLWTAAWQLVSGLGAEPQGMSCPAGARALREQHPSAKELVGSSCSSLQRQGCHMLQRTVVHVQPRSQAMLLKKSCFL